MNAGRRRAGGYQVFYGEADQEGGELEAKWKKKPVIDQILYPML